MTPMSKRLDYILARHGTTYAEQAGIALKDKPSPLYQLLVLSTLLSARISSDIGVQAAHELFKDGLKTPQHMREASWQQRVDALGRGHYRRLDESTATTLEKSADLLIDQYDGDLRKLRDESNSVNQLRDALQQFTGIGPAGASIFIREVQGIWDDFAPHLDSKTKDGARLLDLRSSSEKFVELVTRSVLLLRVASCVGLALSQSVVDDVKESGK